MTSNLPPLPTGWEWKKLGEVSDFQGGSQPPKDEFSSVPLEGYVRLIQIRDYKSDDNIIYVKKESVRRFCNETDIMVGRYGPPVFQILRGLNGAYNVALMKAVFDEKIIDKDYLYFFLKNPNIQNYIIGLSQRAAGQSGVNKDALETYPFPLPPLDEQKRLVSLLDTLFAKIDRSIDLLDENITATDLLLPSALNTVFGELGEQWEIKLLKDVATIKRGKSKHRPRNDPKLFGGIYPFFQTGDVRNANKYLTNFQNTYSELGLSQSKLWEKGTVCITIAANIGDVAILGIDGCFPDSVIGIQSEKNDNEYIYYFLLTLKMHLENQATTTAQMNINQKILEMIEIPLPPLDIQTQTVTYLDSVRDRVERLKAAQNMKKSQLIDLKASILDRAFKGEL